MLAKQKVEKLLSFAGISVNGNKPYDITVHNECLYKRVLVGGSLAIGESYVDGWWDSEDLAECFTRIFTSKLDGQLRAGLTGYIMRLRAKFSNLQNKKRSLEVGKKHYDIGNVFFERMLDDRMVYSCGYWKDAQTLEEAQIAKLDLVCKKIRLQRGQRILDIGCGFGSFAKFAAENYGVSVVGITISEEQVKFATENVKGLPVEIRFQDYRDIREKFDHVVSIGMFEHVGHKNYKEYIEVVSRSLKEDGFFLLHTILKKSSVFTTDPWIEKYIFPNGMLPSLGQVEEATYKLLTPYYYEFLYEDYDKTLMAWFENFDSHWNEIRDNYSERFYREQKYFLLTSAATFRSQKNMVCQIVLSKGQIEGEYISPSEVLRDFLKSRNDDSDDFRTGIIM